MFPHPILLYFAQRPSLFAALLPPYSKEWSKQMYSPVVLYPNKACLYAKWLANELKVTLCLLPSELYPSSFLPDKRVQKSAGWTLQVSFLHH